jgi:hypothetical protein
VKSAIRVAHILLLSTLLPVAVAVENANNPAPNSNPTYQQLRNIGLSGEAVTVKDFTFKRDAAAFHLTSGTICFLDPVQGKVTGAVFSGEGTMAIEPPITDERRTLKLLSREDKFNETYKQLVMRFTDSTYAELKNAGTAASGGCDSGLFNDSRHDLRHDPHLRFNLDGRILQDVLAAEPGGLFVAFIRGQKYSSKEAFAIDPHGAPPFMFVVAPEEVEFLTYEDTKNGIWASFHLADEYKQGKASSAQDNSMIHVEHQTLETTMEKSGNLIGNATTTFVSQVQGLRVVPFHLFSRLRVATVTSDSGQPLSFIQEGKDEDARYFSVILARPLSAGEKCTIVTKYEGKDAVSNEGGGNYFPVARDDWYPNVTSGGFGSFTNYDLTFRIPRGMKMVASGNLVSENNKDDQNVTVWKSEVPQTVAGFNFGKFKMQEAKTQSPVYLVQSYANEQAPDWVQNLRVQAVGNDLLSGMHLEQRPQATLGNLDTTGLEKKALAEGQLSLVLYSDYFGPLPFKNLAMTQQTACNYGQSWPTLVWLPLCSFFDGTVRHQLGLDFADYGYWKTVAPHEVAHQWWGNTVGFSSYRDQWMSEGFADFSASLFIQMVEKNPKKFIDFWNDERELLTMRDKEGYRAIDAGPLTMGYRLSNTRTGLNVPRQLIYPKGAYILQMVRMMMWDRRSGDQNFKATMQDFVRTYSGRDATTEDFKATIEKHQTPEMAALGGGKMDWFFDEYVYGTALPTYSLQSSFDKDANGDVVFSFKAIQSNVTDSFRMLVPIYLEMADGRALFLGRARMIGNTTLEQKVPLKGLKDLPKRAVLNYYDDVLATAN